MLNSILLAGSLIMISSSAEAGTFGSSYNGASSYETAQIRYDGAAWNYSSSPYKYAAFQYSRGGRTLMYKTAYSGKITGWVADDLRIGSQYTTYFNWFRGPNRFSN